MQLNDDGCHWQSRVIIFSISTPLPALDFLQYYELRGDQRGSSGHFHRSNEASRLADSDLANVPGETLGDKRRFLVDVPNDDPYLRPLYERAIDSPDGELRVVGAYGIKAVMPLAETIPILLRMIANDPVPSVRATIAEELHCRFLCGGASHDADDVAALESQLPLLIVTVSANESGHYISEIVTSVWCELGESARARLARARPALAPQTNCRAAPL